MFWKFRYPVVVVALLILSAGRAGAQTDRAAAEVLFQEGRKAMKQQDFAAACPKFAESLRLDRAPGTLLNLAECEEKLGKLASAWQRFDELVQTLKRDDPRFKRAQRRATELGKTLPRVTIQLRSGSASTESVRIKLDGVELSTASVGVALPVDPGSHVIQVTAPGHSAKSYDIEIARGEKKQLDVELGPVEEAAPVVKQPAPVVTKPKREEPKSSPPTLGYVIGGVGIVAIIVSGVAGGVALGKKRTVEKECSDKFCTDEGLAAADSGKTWSTVATISFAGGLVLTGIGAFLVVSHDREKKTSTVTFRGQF